MTKNVWGDLFFRKRLGHFCLATFTRLGVVRRNRLLEMPLGNRLEQVGRTRLQDESSPLDYQLSIWDVNARQLK